MLHAVMTSSETAPLQSLTGKIGSWLENEWERTAMHRQLAAQPDSVSRSEGTISIPLCCHGSWIGASTATADAGCMLLSV